MMFIRLGSSGVLVLLATACATVSVPVVDRNHPAHPEAETAPLPEASTILGTGAGSTRWESERTETRPVELHMGHQHGGAESDTLFACPMHPEVTSSEKGECPICGMYLAPVEKEEMDHEERSHED